MLPLLLYMISFGSIGITLPAAFTYLQGTDYNVIDSVSGKSISSARSQSRYGKCKYTVRLEGFSAGFLWDDHLCVYKGLYEFTERGDRYVVYGQESWFGRTMDAYSFVTKDNVVMDKYPMPTASERFGHLAFYTVVITLFSVVVIVNNRRSTKATTDNDALKGR